MIKCIGGVTIKIETVKDSDNLYLMMGFQEVKQAELNPAGLPTVVLKREAVQME
jgi:hypothetical protein